MVLNSGFWKTHSKTISDAKIKKKKECFWTANKNMNDPALDERLNEVEYSTCKSFIKYGKQLCTEP